jgi:hypothetical protein
MKNLWKKFINLFKRKPVEKPVEPPKEDATIKHVILIAGHEDNGGMTTYRGMSENEYCRRLVWKIKASYPRSNKVILLKRKHSSYTRYLSQIRRDISGLNIDLSKTLIIEMHLNSATESARGCEALVFNSRSVPFAADMAQNFHDWFNVKLRGEYCGKKGVRKRATGSGSGFLSIVNKLGAYGIIWEPVFAGYKTEESAVFFEDIEHGIYLMNNFCVDFIVRVLK